MIGTVTDPIERSWWWALKVTITETGTEARSTTNVSTGTSGDFLRPALKPSTYSGESRYFAAPGFKTAEQKRYSAQSRRRRTGVNVSR